MCLIYWLFFLVLILRINCQHFFIAKKNNTYVCVTNSSSALSWISPNSTHSLNRVSRYIPDSPKNYFDSKISNDFKTKQYFAKNPWFLRRYVKSSIILDRRWEDIYVYLTTPNPVNSTSTYLNAGSVLGNGNFSLAFSVRAKYEANIFLCDSSESPLKSNCYWFILEGSEGTISSLKKCNSLSENVCVSLTETRHPPFRKILEENSWSHFQIKKRGPYISLQVLDGLEDNTVLEVKDDTYKVRNFFIQSTSVNVSWKFPAIDFIGTFEVSTDIKLGPPISVKENFVCISMIVSMCNFCHLKLKLMSDAFLIREEVFNARGDNKLDEAKWFEIKFVADTIFQDIHLDKMDLLVSTNITGNSKETPFWYIDEVRLCQKNEFRMITLSEKASCQMMSETTQLAAFDDSSDELVPSSVNNCPEDTIGTLCVPCKWIFDNCDEIQVCAKTCWCSAGFEYLPECIDKCHGGYYGHGCSQECGKCSEECNIKTGTCPFCVKNYIGPKCDRTPVGTIEGFHITWTPETKMLLEWDQSGREENKVEKFSIFVFTSTSNVTLANSSVFSGALELPDSSVYRNRHYSYSVNATFPPSTAYLVRVVADNKYSTKFATIYDTSPPEVPFLLKRTCLSSETTITLEVLPKVNNSYNVIVLISDNSGNLYTHPELKSSERTFDLDLSKYRKVHSFKNFNGSAVIGNGGVDTRNFPLVANTSYSVRLILTATYKNKTSSSVYFLSCRTETKFEYSYFIYLLPAFLVPVVLLIVYLMWRKNKKFRGLFSTDRSRLVENTDSIEMKPSNLNNKAYQSEGGYLEPVSPSMPISVKLFEQYVEESQQDIERQFTIIDGTKKIYDEIEGNHFFHYIDMIYVNGSVTPKAYLLTEVPNDDKKGNFWKCIYEGNVNHIVLLTKEDEDCSRYWPLQKETFRFDNVSVRMVSEKTYPDYKYNVFDLENKVEKRQVDQISFSYTGSNVKKYISFLRKLMEYSLSKNSPILMHSSDSMKRIGFVLLCDMSLRMAKEEKVIDVLKNFKRLMDQVGYLIDDLRLYKLSHSVISEFVFEDKLVSNLVNICNNLEKSNAKQFFYDQNKKLKQNI